MSTEERNNEEELKYFERLNISVLSIDNIKNLIKGDIKNTINAWDGGREVQKQCFHIIGPAGVGKTEICNQIASELGEELEKEFNIIMIKAPVLSRDDFIIPFPIIDNGNTSFKMLYSDFVPKGEDTYGLFVIDEFSRGDHSLQQLLWQVQNEYSIHRYPFPRGWFVVSIDNPDDSEYSMDTMEDSAGLRRQLHLYTEVSVKDFLDYAISQKFHAHVIEFVQTHPDYLYDFQAQKLGSVYSNPASYEKLSDILWKYEMNGGIDKHYPDIEVLSSGLLNVNMARMFIEFIRDQKDINPKDVFFNLNKVEPLIKRLMVKNNNAKLGELMNGFCTFLTTSKPEYTTKELNNVATFLSMMEIDTAAIFVTQIDSLPRTSEEFKYINRIHASLIKSSEIYRTKFYESIVEVGG
jgi:hypothetical protein